MHATCSLHDENLLFEHLIPQFQKSDFINWPVNQHVALVRGLLTSQADICTSCLWTMIIDRTGPSESGLCMLLHNTTAVIIITLGFMTFRFWHEWDSGKAGGRKCWLLSQKRELKTGISDPTLCIKWPYSPDQRDFCNVFRSFQPVITKKKLWTGPRTFVLNLLFSSPRRVCEWEWWDGDQWGGVPDDQEAEGVESILPQRLWRAETSQVWDPVLPEAGRSMQAEAGHWWVMWCCFHGDDKICSDVSMTVVVMMLMFRCCC